MLTKVWELSILATKHVDIELFEKLNVKRMFWKIYSTRHFIHFAAMFRTTSSYTQRHRLIWTTSRKFFLRTLLNVSLYNKISKAKYPKGLLPPTAPYCCYRVMVAFYVSAHIHLLSKSSVRLRTRVPIFVRHRFACNRRVLYSFITLDSRTAKTEITGSMYVL